MMDVKNYETANSWFSKMHSEGYSVPIVLCQAIEKIMKDEKVTFPVAYGKLDSKHLISVKKKEISFKSL